MLVHSGLGSSEICAAVHRRMSCRWVLPQTGLINGVSSEMAKSMMSPLCGVEELRVLNPNELFLASATSLCWTRYHHRNINFVCFPHKLLQHLFRILPASKALRSAAGGNRGIDLSVRLAWLVRANRTVKSEARHIDTPTAPRLGSISMWKAWDRLLTSPQVALISPRLTRRRNTSRCS